MLHPMIQLLLVLLFVHLLTAVVHSAPVSIGVDGSEPPGVSGDVTWDITHTYQSSPAVNLTCGDIIVFTWSAKSNVILMANVNNFDTCTFTSGDKTLAQASLDGQYSFNTSKTCGSFLYLSSSVTFGSAGTTQCTNGMQAAFYVLPAVYNLP